MIYCSALAPPIQAAGRLPPCYHHLQANASQTAAASGTEPYPEPVPDGTHSNFHAYLVSATPALTGRVCLARRDVAAIFRRTSRKTVCVLGTSSSSSSLSSPSGVTAGTIPYIADRVA